MFRTILNPTPHPLSISKPQHKMAYEKRPTKDLESLYHHDYDSLIEMAKKNRLTGRDVQFLARLPQYELGGPTFEQMERDEIHEKWGNLVTAILMGVGIGVSVAVVCFSG
jgi:hypothetical protein